MGNSPSKPENDSKASSSPTSSSHGQTAASQTQKRGHSRRATASGTIGQSSESATLLSSHSLSPPRKPSLKPQQFFSGATSNNSSNRRGSTMGNSQSHDKGASKPNEHEEEPHTGPVQVPIPSHHTRRKTPDNTLEPSAPPADTDYVPMSNLNFPPRLPLPIQEEVYTPGSPIITPDDLSTALQEDDEGALARHTSLLSHTTLDDDEDVAEIDQTVTGKTVPTHVEWKHGGNKVYVTGTFANWGKKYRMHRSGNDHVLTTTLELPPGTHHLKFIVDGEMHLSSDLPTAVDYTNVLVNYIEVSADDIPKDGSNGSYPSGLHPPMVLPPGVQTTDFEPESTAEEPQEKHETISTRNTRFGKLVPRYLNDLDREPQSHRFQRAANQVQEIPTPPSLPMFLSKSILNGVMPMKDDSSVLNMPNHTVLNHLATSSIKNEVLATSLTTRYKRKYVTTIIYRATTDDHDTSHTKTQQ